jgi:hypothetical protein
MKLFTFLLYCLAIIILNCIEYGIYIAIVSILGLLAFADSPDKDNDRSW